MVVFEITRVWRWDEILVNTMRYRWWRDKENIEKEILFRDVEREIFFFFFNIEYNKTDDENNPCFWSIGLLDFFSFKSIFPNREVKPL